MIHFEEEALDEATLHAKLATAETNATAATARRAKASELFRFFVELFCFFFSDATTAGATTFLPSSPFPFSSSAFLKNGPGSIPSSAATMRSLARSGSRCGRVQFLIRRKTQVVLVGGGKEKSALFSSLFFCVCSSRPATMRAILCGEWPAWVGGGGGREKGNWEEEERARE